MNETNEYIKPVKLTDISAWYLSGSRGLREQSLRAGGAGNRDRGRGRVEGRNMNERSRGDSGATLPPHTAPYFQIRKQPPRTALFRRFDYMRSVPGASKINANARVRIKLKLQIEL
ncbi:hypothetical protein GWI33_015365 [Rhynchophorus ferrugineus]|uniref:Uncharacterized protein n=1 Tax=Rhynchophorus ferrugineus TaxID=354439 RepID=A0A834HZH6_RHYFE|nr:hypothetical protein GWI33_015365 [Rhynchophorus ferrugineus]